MNVIVDGSSRTLPADACQRSAGDPGVTGRPFSMVILSPPTRQIFRRAAQSWDVGKVIDIVSKTQTVALLQRSRRDGQRNQPGGRAVDPVEMAAAVALRSLPEGKVRTRLCAGGRW